MLNLSVIEPEWLAIASFLSLGVAAAFMALATTKPDTPLKRFSFGLGLAFIPASILSAIAFLSYPVEPAGYETFQPAFDCVRRVEK